MKVKEQFTQFVGDLESDVFTCEALRKTAQKHGNVSHIARHDLEISGYKDVLDITQKELKKKKPSMTEVAENIVEAINIIEETKLAFSDVTTDEFFYLLALKKAVALAKVLIS